MESRDQIVLEWARRHYPDADATFERFSDYYYREMNKEVQRKTNLSVIRTQQYLLERQSNEPAVITQQAQG